MGVLTLGVLVGRINKQTTPVTFYFRRMNQMRKSLFRNSFFLLIFGLAGLFVSLGCDPLAGSEQGKGILLQGFGWNSTNGGAPSKWYRLIGDRAKDLADLGVTMVWFPPVGRSVSPQGYLPGDFYDLGSPQSPTFYGDLPQLQKCLSDLHAAGLKAIADIVINHRCAGKQDQNGIWNIFHFSSGKAAWEQWAVVRGEYGGTGGSDSGDK